MKFILFLLALYGGYVNVTGHYGLHEFHDFVVYSAKHKDSPLSEPIDYYAGTIYYLRASYPQAEEALSQLLIDHPDTRYAAPALVKLEDAQEYDRNWDGARESCQKYIDRHADGSDIELMRKRLELLGDKHSS